MININKYPYGNSRHAINNIIRIIRMFLQTYREVKLLVLGFQNDSHLPLTAPRGTTQHPPLSPVQTPRFHQQSLLSGLWLGFFIEEVLWQGKTFTVVGSSLRNYLNYYLNLRPREAELWVHFYLLGGFAKRASQDVLCVTSPDRILHCILFFRIQMKTKG